MGDSNDLCELFHGIDSTNFSSVFYDIKAKRELSPRLFYTYVLEITKALEELSAKYLLIACLIKPCLILPSAILGILRVSSYFAFLDINKPLVSLANFQKYVSIKVILVEKTALESIRRHLCSCWICEQELEFESSPSMILLHSKSCTSPLCPNSKPQMNPNPKLCYAIQTSGTTGEAKVVQVPRQCILPNIFDLRSRFGMTDKDAVLLCSPLTFDPSLIDIFLAMASGCRLVVVSDQVKTNPSQLRRVIVDSKVTIIQCTPSLLQSLGEEFIQQCLLSGSSPLRVLALGGEPCPSLAKLRRWKASSNSTRIFNLYGLTEVSCWATCCEVDLNKQTLGSVPLGDPLQDTAIEIKDEEVVLGGPKRWCVINAETWPLTSNFSIMRPTGDLVQKDSNGNIYFRGRKDSIIKYKGKKLSVDKISGLLEEFSEISYHYIHFDENSSKLFLFIVKSDDNLQLEGIRSKILTRLRQDVPNLPRTKFIPVSHIPLTSHGKINHRKLLQLAQEKTYQKGIDSDVNIESIIQKLWKEYLKVELVSDADNFIFRGGDSASAVQFLSDIEWELQVQIPELVDTLLNRTYKEVMQLVLQVCHNKFNPLVSHSFQPDGNNIVHKEDLVPPKRLRLNGFQCRETSSRRGHRIFCNHPQESSCSVVKSENLGGTIGKQIDLQMFCKFDLKKCVDASPTAAYFFQSDLLLVYIGSHSGLFVCYNIFKQENQWATALPDRIESSACLSECGNFVLVGCYDHHLYCFDSLSGSSLWKFEAGAEIKSSPVVSSQNIAFVGSHDKHLYAIKVRGGSLLWKKQVGEGSVFSSPALCEDLSIVAVATLDGVLSVLHMDNGSTLWSYNHGKPIFSSPLFCHSYLFIGSTDKKLLKLNSLTGSLIGEHDTNGPVFSTASKNEHHIVFGCHDSNIYCLSPDGSLTWHYQCDSAVYSTPFMFQCGDDRYVAVACTTGTLYVLCEHTGRVLCTYKCSGEIFSSVMVLRGFLIVGCRDNYVYCFKLNIP